MAGSSTSSGFEVVGQVSSFGSPSSGYSGPASGPFQELYTFSSQSEEPVTEASSPRALDQLFLESLGHLLGRLRAPHSVWAPKARVARAFRAGILARRRLGEEILGEGSLVIPFRNSYYLVLRSLDYPHGFWTRNYIVYQREVSRGAILPWPPQLR